jgi:hypothetical protein
LSLEGISINHHHHLDFHPHPTLQVNSASTLISLGSKCDSHSFSEAPKEGCLKGQWSVPVSIPQPGPGKLPIRSLRLVSATATTTTTDTNSVSEMLGGRKTGKGLKHRLPTTLCYYRCSSSRYLDYNFEQVAKEP